jgi:peptidoglycan LD-endopeptidase CwlK
MLAAAELQGLDILIYCTLRSNAEQAKLYASGRSYAGPILTNSGPGESLHNPDERGQAWAFDAVPLLHGVPAWDDAERVERMGVIGESVGLKWAGRWRGKLRERVHFQLARGAV